MKKIIKQIIGKIKDYRYESSKAHLIEKIGLLGIRNYTINDDLSIDVNESVVLAHKDITEIPIKFRNVSGSFLCQHNHLKSLKNAPAYVGKDFICSHNNLKSLKYSPKIVMGDFNCNQNKIVNFKDSPEYIGQTLLAVNNNIKDFEYFPNEVKGVAFLTENPVRNLDKLHNCKAPKAIHIAEDDDNIYLAKRYTKEELEKIICRNNVLIQKENLENTLTVKEDLRESTKRKMKI